MTEKVVCPYCDMELIGIELCDKADATPGPGKFGVCTRCSRMAVFGTEGRLVKLTQADVDRFNSHQPREFVVDIDGNFLMEGKPASLKRGLPTGLSPDQRENGAATGATERTEKGPQQAKSSPSPKDDWQAVIMEAQPLMHYLVGAAPAQPPFPGPLLAIQMNHDKTWIMPPQMGLKFAFRIIETVSEIEGGNIGSMDDLMKMLERQANEESES